MLSAVVILLCCVVIAFRLGRKTLRLRKLQEKRATSEAPYRQKIGEICDLAVLTDRMVTIHRGLPGYTTMTVYPDFLAHMAARGKTAADKPDFAQVQRSLHWWIAPRWYGVTLAPNRLGFHAMDKDDPTADPDLMPVTHKQDDVRIIADMIHQFHQYLGLPDALFDARKPKIVAPSISQSQHQSQHYDITPTNKWQYIMQYVESGDYRDFFDMFDAEYDQPVMLWIDHREDDEDIAKNCESILKTGDLDSWWADDDTLDLIIRFRGTHHRIVYPNDYADRDTTIIALNRIIQPDYELRYCTASDGGDTGAFLPATRAEWDKLEKRFPRGVGRLFEPIDNHFKKMGGSTR